jgi:Fic/DOC family N-terminal
VGVILIVRGKLSHYPKYVEKNLKYRQIQSTCRFIRHIPYMVNFDPEQPYNALPLIPPSGEIETKIVLKACIEARAAVAELKHCGGLIPNQAMLINTIPGLEAQASSEIENIVTTADRLFQFAIFIHPRFLELLTAESHTVIPYP